MAGGGSLGGGEKAKRGKSSKRKKKKRVGFVLDMTPLVDITFLLLTFFMFTTTMAQPQVMEMKLPPEIDEQIEVKESELFSILVDDEGDLFWFIASEPAEELALKDLKNVAKEKNLEASVRNRLITVLKVSEEAPYGKLIEVLDELNLAEIGIMEGLMDDLDPETEMPVARKRKFTIAEFTEDDRAKIADFQEPIEDDGTGNE